jgi:homoserine kinase type II
MKQYSILKKQDVTRILKPYSIKNLTNIEKLSGGSENTNYLITANNHHYVLSLFENKSLDHVKVLAQLLLHLNENNFKASQTVSTTNGQTVTCWNKKPIIIKHFIEGEIMDTLPNHIIELVGEATGKLHQVPPPDYLPKTLDYGQENFKLVNQYAPKTSFEDWIQAVRRYIQPYLKIDLPKAFTHSDLFCSNIIISSDKKSVTIIDFEESTYYYRVFDIGMAIIGLCSEGKVLNQKKVKSFLLGYKKEIKLTPDEEKALQPFTVYAGASMTFWRHKNFNYVYPNMGLNNHYKALQALADYAKAQSSLFFKC